MIQVVQQDIKNVSLPVPNGLDEIVNVFGSPCGVQLAAVIFKQPIGAIHATRCHVKLRDIAQSVFDEIAATGSNPLATSVSSWNLLDEYDGCFCCRAIRGQTRHYSTHSWGIAFDLNAAHNPLASIPPASFDATHPFVFTSDHPIVKIFKKHGFTWGGEFQHRKDPMHFQYSTGY